VARGVGYPLGHGALAGDHAYAGSGDRLFGAGDLNVAGEPGARGRLGFCRGRREVERVAVDDLGFDRSLAAARRPKRELAGRRQRHLVEAVAGAVEHARARHRAGLVDLEHEHDVGFEAFGARPLRIVGLHEAF
jgi:hypothetical protein